MAPSSTPSITGSACDESAAQADAASDGAAEGSDEGSPPWLSGASDAGAWEPAADGLSAAGVQAPRTKVRINASVRNVLLRTWMASSMNTGVGFAARVALSNRLPPPLRRARAHRRRATGRRPRRPRRRDPRRSAAARPASEPWHGRSAEKRRISRFSSARIGSRNGAPARDIPPPMTTWSMPYSRTIVRIARARWAPTSSAIAFASGSPSAAARKIRSGPAPGLERCRVAARDRVGRHGARRPDRRRRSPGSRAGRSCRGVRRPRPACGRSRRPAR